jgi:hypothetical protein
MKQDIATYHFRNRLSERFGIHHCSKEVQKEIVFRINNGLWDKCRKYEKGKHKYELFTEGLLKSMLPTIPDKIRVVYDKDDNKLVTVTEAD